MNINRLSIDLSHWEDVADWNQVKAAGIYGVIYKATQGNSYHDATYWNARAAALKAGLLWGSYHFGDGSSVQQQIQNYLDFAKPTADELFCLDLENWANQMTLAQARVFVEGVESELNRPGECVLYSGNVIKEFLGSQVDDFWGSRRLWLAQYGPLPVVQVSWKTYWLWQYTDGTNGPQPHTVPGVNEGKGIDCNHFDGTPAELAASWASGPSLIPVPPDIPPVPPENVVKILIQASPGVKVEVTQQ